MDIQMSWALSQCLRLEFPEYPKYPEYPEYPKYPKYPKYPEYDEYPEYAEYPYGYSSVLGPLPMSQS